MTSFPSACKRVLMITPDYFDIEYSINPHMVDAEGRLKCIDKPAALRQWQTLKSAFEAGGLKVETLPGRAGFPDMVFSANQCLPFLHPRTGKPTAILSRMRAEQRRGEVAFFRDWFAGQGYEIAELEDRSLSFEANGDLVPHPSRGVFWGGYGARTDRKCYAEISKRFGLEILELALVHPDYYHLDTCFAVLDRDTCVIVKDAFNAEGLTLICRHFPNVIEADPVEARTKFVANCFSPNGREVYVQSGAPKFIAAVSKAGLTAVEVDTSEYIKSGGSVFCMKLALPN